MEGFSTKPEDQKAPIGAADLSVAIAATGVDTSGSAGTPVLDANFKDLLSQTIQAPVTAADVAPTPADDHDHGATGTGGNPAFHADLGAVDVKSIDLSNAQGRGSLRKLFRTAFSRGDFLDAGGGKNTVIGSGGNDIIVGRGKGFNTITTGTGRDSIVLGEETTNRVFDFDPAKDVLAIDSSVPMENIVIAQGKNPGKGGLNQPLDSVNNTLIIDKREGHILGVLTFTKADTLSDKNFVQVRSNLVDAVRDRSRFANVAQAGDGGEKLTGTLKRDKLLGGAGDDFLYVGDDGVKFNTAKGTGPGEFPFPNPSPGTSEVNTTFKDGVLRVNGTYQNFDGAPLFSQGETEIASNATILNGSDPKALIANFLKVPTDVEGNKISGTHMHFSPSEDSRGNSADATVVRYFTNTPTDAKSGTISGEFELSSEEQAALLAGNLYLNIHTNIDTDKDGTAGYPTGENRINFNQNVVQFTQPEAAGFGRR